MNNSDLVFVMIKKEPGLRTVAQALYWKNELNAKTLQSKIEEYILDTTVSGLARMWLRNNLSHVDWNKVSVLLMEEAALGAEDSWTK